MKRKTPRPIKSKALLYTLRGMVDATKQTIKVTKKAVKIARKTAKTIGKAKVKGITRRKNK